MNNEAGLTIKPASYSFMVMPSEKFLQRCGTEFRWTWSIYSDDTSLLGKILCMALISDIAEDEMYKIIELHPVEEFNFLCPE